MTQTESPVRFAGDSHDLPLPRRVFDEWSPRLRRYAASILRDPDSAADAVQDVLVKLIQADPTDLPVAEPALRAWLFTAVRHRCIDILRKEGRMSLLDDYPPDTATLRLAAGDDPAQVAESHETVSHALAALDQLPPLQREALRLRFSGELSYRQIAESMDKSVSHVGVLIHEGLRTLRHQLAH